VRVVRESGERATIAVVEREVGVTAPVLNGEYDFPCVGREAGVGDPQVAVRHYLFSRGKRAVGKYERVTPAVVADEHRNASIVRDVHRLSAQRLRYPAVSFPIEGEHVVVE